MRIVTKAFLRYLLRRHSLSLLQLLGIACGVAAVYLDTSFSDAVVASLMASVVFFAGVGIVLHVLANANLPDLRVKR